MPHRLPALLDADPRLRRRGRTLTAEVMLVVGARSWKLHVREGAIVRVEDGPFLLPSCTLALHAEPQAWAAFLSPEPPPRLHDLMALLPAGALRIEGDLRPFVAHLLWFKGVAAHLRAAGWRA